MVGLTLGLVGAVVVGLPVLGPALGFPGSTVGFLVTDPGAINLSVTVGPSVVGDCIGLGLMGGP